MLYVVLTPVGNLADITHRALTVLNKVDLILCKDTRTSQVLLRHYNIKKALQPYHQHNEHRIVNELVAQLQNGTAMALITDAGTPGISDPAFLLVRACIQNGVAVQTLPGATAFVPALVNSGLPANRFVFEGFLPPKKGRHTLLTKLAGEERTMIFYESPMRLVKTLDELSAYFGKERPGSVSREISKKFEETVRGSLAELAEYYRSKPVRGEIVLVVGGKGD